MFKMLNETYDTLKFIAMIVLPALGSLYFGISEIWNLPYGAEIVGTISVLTTFLSTILKISSNKYYPKEDDLIHWG